MPEHLAWPVVLAGSGFATVTQDDIEEVQQNVTVICATETNTYLHQPELGIPDPTFLRAPIDTEAIELAIADLEERAEITVTDDTDDRTLAQGRDRVTIRVALTGAT